MGKVFPRSDAGGKRLTTFVVALGLVAGMLTPVDLVWCSSVGGHSAIENALVGCCGADGDALSCVTPAATADTTSQAGGAGVSNTKCNDVSLGAPASVSPAARQHSLAATPAELPVWAHVRATARRYGVAPCRGGGSQLRASLRSTVLTL